MHGFKILSYINNCGISFIKGFAHSCNKLNSYLKKRFDIKNEELVINSNHVTWNNAYMIYKRNSMSIYLTNLSLTIIHLSSLTLSKHVYNWDFCKYTIRIKKFLRIFLQHKHLLVQLRLAVVFYTIFLPTTCELEAFDQSQTRKVNNYYSPFHNSIPLYFIVTYIAQWITAGYY